MKVSINRLTKSFLLLMFAAGNSLLKPFGDGLFFWSTNDGVKKMCFLLSVLCFLLCLWKFRRSNKFLNLSIGIIIVAAIIAVFRSEDVFTTALLSSLNYYYVLAAIPIYSLLVNKRWPLKNLLRSITIIAFLSYFLKGGITIIEYITGNVVFPTIALESVGRLSYRNHFLRINPPAFGIIIIPIAMYLYYTETIKRKKLFSLGVAFISIIYSGLIHQARSMLVYQLLEFIFLILLRYKGRPRNVVIFSIVATGFVFFVNSSIGNEFIDSFSPEGLYGNSTTSRLYAYSYFGSKWLNSSLFLGTGFLQGNNYTLMGEFTIQASLWDIGFLTTIVQMGLLALSSYILFIVYGFKAGKRIEKYDKSLKLLAYGIVVSMILTAINIDWFIDIFAVSVPIGFAVIAYIGYLCGSENQLEDDNLIKEVL